MCRMTLLLLIRTLHRTLHTEPPACEIISERGQFHVNSILFADQVTDVIACPHASLQTKLIGILLDNDAHDLLLLLRGKNPFFSGFTTLMLRFDSFNTILCVCLFDIGDVSFTHVQDSCNFSALHAFLQHTNNGFADLILCFFANFLRVGFQFLFHISIISYFSRFFKS